MLTLSFQMRGTGREANRKSVRMLTIELNIPVDHLSQCLIGSHLQIDEPMLRKVSIAKHFAEPVGGRKEKSQAAATGVHWKINVPIHESVKAMRKAGERISEHITPFPQLDSPIMPHKNFTFRVRCASRMRKRAMEIFTLLTATITMTEWA